MSYALLGLLAIIVVIVIALITKRTTPALLCGVILMCIFVGKGAFVSTFYKTVYTQLISDDIAYVILLCVFLLLVLNFLNLTRASEIFSNVLAKKARTARSTLIWTWILSLALFIDESLKVGVLGTLTPLYDKNKVPRASLAYIADSTAGPLSTMIPITWWSVYCQSVFNGFDELKSFGKDGFTMYVQSMPYMFYAIAALLVVTLFAFGIIPPIGPMKKAYQRAEKTGKLYGEESERLNQIVENTASAEELDKKGLRLVVFVFTILFMTVGVIKTQDITTVCMICAAILAIVSLLTRLCSLKELLAGSLETVKLVATLAVLFVCAFSFKSLLGDIGFPEYIANVAGPILTPAVFPCVAFILCCLLTFGTGSNLGIATVFASISVPVGIAIGAAPALIIASVVSGATFGAHICFYTDYTVECSLLTRIDNMEHALTQLPYGLIAGGAAAIAFLGAGFIV